jgi:gluconolactonase
MEVMPDAMTIQPSITPLLPKEAFSTFIDGLDHPEGLAFDDEQVLWAGGELGQIYRIDTSGRSEEIVRLGGFCLGLTFSSRQELWVCNSGLHALMKIDRKGRVLQTIDRAGDRPLITPNFSVFDHEGNLYFSDSGEWERANGFVYCLRPNGSIELIAGPLAFPNGLAMSADCQFLFIVVSQRDHVLRIPVSAGHAAGEAEIYADQLARVPDGLAFDVQGNLYVTCYASDCIYRVSSDRTLQLLAFDPEGTRIARPTNAAFGGAALDDLYVANLGRWHISRVHLGVAGQRLANL